jgi:hypothetical protein
MGAPPGTSAPIYVLRWQLYEVRGKKVEVVAGEMFDETDHWPEPGLIQKFDERFSLEMIRSGHIRWRLDGAPPKRGWIMLPDERSR